ncbi:hypothetical protein L198_06244 [Cryptococcus wingfieldii CBS 7118]|uniref:Protein kinase domain-containing protein n=1 Tax=Cryptococcus wingfieldii CBS 7118 TaxID=1295528 RepID=A0A1E3IQL4_9TREE|nr:hypothetical protein L198_06244 [Cryptococcus wingfieldii CBS 7118]ODN90226.1 hypothetical protein L198_06244 [Cryptococcus wingfieldii CBS 7118]
MRPSTSYDANGFAEYESAPEAIETWEKVAMIFAGPLAALQGKIVPKCFGAGSGVMYASRERGRRDVYLWVLERVDDDVVANRYLFRSLHNVRVLHYRHLLCYHVSRRADGNLCLVDFEEARFVPPGEDGDEDLEMEMRDLESTLGLEGR